MDFELHDQEIHSMNSIEHEFHAVGSRTQFQCSNEFGERDECRLDIVIRSRWLHTMIQNHVDCNAIAMQLQVAWKVEFENSENLDKTRTLSGLDIIHWI